MYDESGAPTWQMHLDVLGSPTFDLGSPSDCPFRWPGQYEDEETGLYYNRNRYYEPSSGGYTSPDPIGLDGGMSLLAYVPDPILWTDPMGLAACGSKNPIVLGETMEDRVRPVAARIGAHTFNPRSTNPSRWMINQRRWIRAQIRSGRQIFDIGIERGRLTGRSDFYATERAILGDAGYHREFVRRVTVNVDGERRSFRLYEWVR
jgi:RHS repeat-associated protein